MNVRSQFSMFFGSRRVGCKRCAQHECPCPAVHICLKVGSEIVRSLVLDIITTALRQKSVRVAIRPKTHRGMAEMDEPTVAQLASLIWPLMAALVGVLESNSLTGALARATILYVIGGLMVVRLGQDAPAHLKLLNDFSIEASRLILVWFCTLWGVWLHQRSLKRL